MDNLEPDGDFRSLNSSMPVNFIPSVTFSREIIQSKLFFLKVNKSPGPDMIHPRVLQELNSVISERLLHIFTLSLKLSQIPEDWKCSTVTVIHKKGKKDCVENYRPISLTCISCKIMESIIRDQLMFYFLSNNLFSDYQYGFINGRSTTLQLLKIVDDWTAKLDTGGQIDIVYTDFEKAFDKVPHIRLLSKLHSYGINTELVHWIESFLCHRTQRVKINGAFSNVKPVLSGIPQGSVLGPLLFVIYINDLPDVCKLLCNIFLFADDSKLYRHIVSENDHILLNQSCQAMFDWCQDWLMSLNTAKCKILTLCKNKKSYMKREYGFNISVDNFVILEHVDCMKDLGVVVDDELSFSDLICEKVKKVYQMLGIIKRNFKDFDKYTFLLLYITMVRSQLEYANSVWNPYRVGLIRDLEKVQKRATKMIKACKNMTYIQRLKFLQLPTLKFRRIRGDMIEVFKILNNIYDVNAVPKLTRNLDCRTRGNSSKLLYNRSKLDINKYSFCNRVVGVWNSLPNWVVTSNNVNCFKNNIDKFWQNEEMYFDWEANLAGCIF